MLNIGDVEENNGTEVVVPEGATGAKSSVVSQDTIRANVLLESMVQILHDMHLETKTKPNIESPGGNHTSSSSSGAAKRKKAYEGVKLHEEESSSEDERGQIEFKYMCEFPNCEKLFKAKSSRKAHMKAKHLSQGKKFGCPVCPKSFDKKSDMNKHKKIHDSNREKIACPTCGKLFSRTDNMTKHQRDGKCPGQDSYPDIPSPAFSHLSVLENTVEPVDLGEGDLSEFL